MPNHSVLVRVPATVANFGGATDCSALALDATLNVKATPRWDGHVGIRYFGENGERVPRDSSNLVVQAMQSALRSKGVTFTGTDLEIYSSVPVAVGLGSSTAAVLAGVIAADQLFALRLSEKAVFELSAGFKERQESLRAAWLGGFVTRGEEGSSSTYRRTAVPRGFILRVVVPEAPLAAGGRSTRLLIQETNPARSGYERRAAAIAEFFSAPAQAPWETLGEFLPPTCEKRVPGLEEALSVRLPGVHSVFACGSGPAVGILAGENGDQAAMVIRECFLQHGVASLAITCRPANVGAREWNAVRPDITLPASDARRATAASSTINMA